MTSFSRDPKGSASPSRWEWAAVAAFAAVAVLYGGLVVQKSALLDRPMGDLGVYLRAAWAVRAEPDRLYDDTDQNGWHYSYPPLFAILLEPLGEAPQPVGADPTPFAVAVGVFYIVNIFCLLLAVHVLASALESASPDPAARSGRWWTNRRRLWLRLWPILVCLPPIGHTLMRGQANLILLLLLCCGMAALIRGRRLLGGASLAGLACIKIFPAYLLLYPLWRRDGKTVAGWVIGLAAGLLLVPALALGPAQTIRCYKTLGVVLIGPALGLSHDDSRAKELIEATATDSQSFLVAMHNTMHLDVDRLHRVPTAAPEVRVAHFVLAGLFTALTLAAASRRRAEDGTGVVLFLGSLTLIMLVSSPVCHTHYFALSLPLVMALTAREWERNGAMRFRPAVWALMAVQFVGNTLPLVMGLEVLKDAGLALYTALALWGTACASLWHGSAAPAAERGEGLARAA